MQIRDLFIDDVTRDIPPVVYFHEQSPEKLADEVSEYIITGGWPEGHPNHRRVPTGIHEQYVRLLGGITAELQKPGGPELPTSWISGFYGSGKSSFAKLLGMALDGRRLPDGRSLAEAWLDRDRSAKRRELHDAWAKLRAEVDPLAVVFDIGGIARDREHLHAAAVRKLQERLRYCSTEPLVADFELKLERDGHWQRFEETALRVLGRPWAEIKDQALAEEDFSLVMSEMYPDHYSDPMSWFTSRGGTHQAAASPEDAARAIRDMLSFREPGATLFFVVDEVSQYVLASKERVDRLRAFATALGSTLHGKAWLLALGQQQLDEEADADFLVWARDRFPPKLRVHLANTNIRDVVHQRLLKKTPAAEKHLRGLFEKHRSDLKLFAYGCDEVTAEEFVDVYPMLPGQIDLILRLTSELRLRSGRAQGDDQAIRGLLQLLGELFNSPQLKLAEMPVGHLVTLDQIYEVQHTALESDVQASMTRLLARCSDGETLHRRAAKAVALLELNHDLEATTADLVARCLYDRVDRGNQTAEVTEALEELRRRNLLGFSEKTGYKIQSSAAEEWERERRLRRAASQEARSERVREALKVLLADPDKPSLENRPFPWAAVYSDGRRADDIVLLNPRDEACVRVDLRYLGAEDRGEADWIRRSGEAALENRLVWVAGAVDQVEELVKELHASQSMVRKYRPRRDTLPVRSKTLLNQEEQRAEDLETTVKESVASAFLRGSFYFRGKPMPVEIFGASFPMALYAAGNRVLPDLYPHFVSITVDPSELMQLLAPELSGPSPKFLADALGLIESDSGRYRPSANGVVPQRVLGIIEREAGISGQGLLATLGAPPYGYPANVVKACVAALLRGGRLKIEPDGGGAEITSHRDAGTQELFDKDRAFRRASTYPAGEDDIGFSARAQICRFFEERLGRRQMEREDHAIADAVVEHFPTLASELRAVESKLDRLPGERGRPAGFVPLEAALEAALRTARQTRKTVGAVKRYLDALRDGVVALESYRQELTDEAVRRVREAHEAASYQGEQLETVGDLEPEIAEALARLRQHLGGERPWREAAALEANGAAIRAAYAARRGELLAWQERGVEQVRGHVRRREGFALLIADQVHHVLQPLLEATSDTSADAISPPLVDLRDRFVLALERAEAEANERLDAFLSRGDRPLIQRLDLELRNRELASEAEVEALLAEMRERLMAAIRSGSRVRLV